MADATEYSVGVYRTTEAKLRCVSMWCDCLYLLLSTPHAMAARVKSLFELCDINGLR